LEAKPLTDRRFWDDLWERVPVGRVSRHHYLFGKNGALLRAMRRHHKDLEGRSIVELGGAGSKSLLALAKWCNAEVTAVDYSPIGLQRTEELFAQNGCRVALVLADFLTWKDGAERFDIAVHWGVLEHFGEPRPVLATCRELVRPGGTVIFGMPNMAAWGAYFWKTWAPRNWATHLFLSDRVVEEACSASGLELVATFHWGPPLLRVCRWEKKGLLQMLVTAAHVAVILFGMVVPIYHLGHGKLSMFRGFVARKR
jgi:2-polyprenyl-3-methyl-5-hydroxy-6-metoxy-1,4-benzoquinol methylase